MQTGSAKLIAKLERAKTGGILGNFGDTYEIGRPSPIFGGALPGVMHRLVNRGVQPVQPLMQPLLCVLQCEVV
jgi:hypothetical protein